MSVPRSSRPPSHRSSAARSDRKLAIACSALAIVLAASCERIAFYSTGKATQEPPTTTTAAGEPTGSSSASGGMTGTTRGALLGAIAACNVELLDAFSAAASEFEASAKEAKDDPKAQEKARAAWVTAIDVWQQIELFQFGPLGLSATPGGQGIRDSIYSWPLVSRCLVEQSLVAKAYDSADFGATALVNTRGFAAAEYLLFYTGTDNACSSSTSINAMGQWAALSPTELAARKAGYASAVAADIATQARKLVKAWAKDGGDFRTQLESAGSSGSVYSSDPMALSAISDAMFYLEITVKDLKLAQPLGMLNCDDATCPQAVESRFAGRSRTHIRNNLLGFRRLMSGCADGQGVGFDDLLTSMNASSIADSMTSAVEEAIAAADAIKTDDLAQALKDDIASVTKLHAAVKKITDILKTDFVTVLNLELPKTVEGDND